MMDFDTFTLLMAGVFFGKDQDLADAVPMKVTVHRPELENDIPIKGVELSGNTVRILV